jgi:hypothetical protein
MSSKVKKATAQKAKTLADAKAAAAGKRVSILMAHGSTAARIEAIPEERQTFLERQLIDHTAVLAQSVADKDSVENVDVGDTSGAARAIIKELEAPATRSAEPAH